MWAKMFNASRYKSQSILVRHCGHNTSKECYFVHFFEKIDILSHCCNQQVVFKLLKSQKTIQSICAFEICQKPILEEKKLPDEYFTTIFEVQDRMSTHPISH